MGGHPRGNRQLTMRAAAMFVLLGVALVADRSAVSAEISLRQTVVSIPEAGFVTHLVWETPGYDFSFTPPRLWKACIDTNAMMLTMQPADLRSVLQVRLLKDQVIPRTPSRSKELEQRVRERFPGAKIRGDFAAYCASHSGAGFELEESRPSGPMTIRLVFLAYADGTVEVELRCPREDFARIQHQFNSMLNSLRIMPRGAS